MKFSTLLATCAATCAITVAVRSQVVQAPFAGVYSINDLGSVPGLPPQNGGLVFKAGDPNKLLVGGNANNASGGIYEIDVVRDANGFVTGFSGTASLYSTAPHIDGGLAYGPNGVLFYTAYNINRLGQIRSGSSVPDKIIDLTPLGVASSVGGLAFVPPNFPGAGGLKLLSFNSNRFYDAVLVADGTGTFDVTSTNLTAQLSGGPEGAAYVPPGSSLIPDYTRVIVSEYSLGTISLFTIDANGDPDPSSRTPMVTGLTGAEGAAIDPITGEFFFSTFGGGNRVVSIRGFGVCGEFVPYGLGAAGTGGAIPTLVGNGCAGRGFQADITVVGGQPGALGFLNAGFAPLNVPVLNGFLLVQLANSFTHTLDSSGQFIFPALIPISPDLNGLDVYFQSLYLDMGAPNPFGVSSTGGLKMTVR